MLTAGSNRTFMELKLCMPILVILAIVCSNRTFMELKYFIYTSVFLS